MTGRSQGRTIFAKLGYSTSPSNAVGEFHGDVDIGCKADVKDVLASLPVIIALDGYQQTLPNSMVVSDNDPPMLSKVLPQ